MTPRKKVPLIKEFSKGLLVENPVLRLILGTCPTLAITTSVKNSLGMGMAVIFVLVGSNLVIASLRKVIPDKVRIPAFITIIAGFVTLVQLLLQAYLPALNDALGIFLPLITVNCIILARAEMFASKNPVLPSILDGIGMGAGYTAAVFCISTIREVIGNGTFLDISLPLLQAGGYFEPMIILILPPGGFFVFGVMIGLAQKLSDRISKKGLPAPEICAGAINDASACLLCGGCMGSRVHGGETAMDRVARQAREQLGTAGAKTSKTGESADQSGQGGADA
ncbi:MAG TPA: electron transport complex subunit RsxE [Clostridiales bacterium]|nr:electron transport complex subunit RsxE [Clostridiales bacterium]